MTEYREVELSLFMASHMKRDVTRLWFYSFDGDQIVRRIQTLILENNIEGAAIFSALVSGELQKLRIRLESLGCTIIFAAGDSVLAVGPANIPIETVLTGMQDVSFSAGAGATPRNALIALSRAKMNGRGSSHRYLEA